MTTITNAIAEFYAELIQAGELCGNPSDPAANSFAPGFDLPVLDDRLERFFSASKIQILDAGEYHGRKIRLLDLTGNPRTRTTKTFASQIMVARAVRHIQKTGESILLVTPSSANKGGALRDAVLRAIECGLVDAHQLRIAIVVPRQGLQKLWASPLSTRPDLKELNPVFIVDTDDGSVIKQITKSFVGDYSELLRKEHGLRVWHTYQLDNYRMADALRAFVEADRMDRPESGAVRVHAQAVSSAFGLLGYDYGRRVLKERLGRDELAPSQWLLVQHLGTPDLVLNQLFGSCSRDNLPKYQLDAADGLLTQDQLKSFPTKTLSLDEVIDSTFYSRNPITVSLVDQVLKRDGGGGIVVSLQECLARYGALRSMLPPEGPQLPADPRELREWALVMVLTGVLGAIDRDLVPRNCEVLVHISGCYSVHDFEPLAKECTVSASSAEDLLRTLTAHG